ncbi:MAG: Thymidylate synthase ThyX [Alphaproteobacteria bacterium MarineAlpha9_Bin4]|nr:thymidylate synthase (FAD) [Pelagibacterales bacterium]PPR26803.1 MAG: Thymidylate synthase ThyX [Alphaproteobacteria bacterium MarineAlpha9_Bin4]|tara:strand:+ start:2745 stop:3662 length:918 start_codon:yes stop_codon:yes gene_type:complete
MKKVKNQINSLRNKKNLTYRPISKGLEGMLFKELKVLDKGYVRVVDYMGNDSSVVQAARVSYGKGTKKKSEDEGLIRYLLRHRHTTPFEMCEIKLHIKLPIFIARQWIRHRTASINEYSARYSILEDEFYIPKKYHLAEQSLSNKQGRGREIDEATAARILKILKEDSLRSYKNYSWMLNEKNSFNHDSNRASLSRELARINLTLNTYTQWYWKIDLHNFMHFVSLRADSHSQFEIREYGKILLKILSKWTPLSYKAFLSYRLNSAELSMEAINTIKKMISGKKVTRSKSGLSNREWKELESLLF